MSDLEEGLNTENYQKLTIKEEDHETKEDLNLHNASLIESPPFTSPFQQKSLPQIVPNNKRSSQQTKALVYKNLTLQSRQIGTNILQVSFIIIDHYNNFLLDSNPFDLFSINFGY